MERAACCTTATSTFAQPCQRNGCMCLVNELPASPCPCCSIEENLRLWNEMFAASEEGELPAATARPVWLRMHGAATMSHRHKALLIAATHQHPPPARCPCRPEELHAHQAGHERGQQGAARPSGIPLQPHAPLAHGPHLQGGGGGGGAVQVLPQLQVVQQLRVVGSVHLHELKGAHLLNSACPLVAIAQTVCPTAALAQTSCATATVPFW